MHLKAFLFAGAALAALASVPAQAGTVCPTGGISVVSTCNLYFNYNANGSITTTAGSGTFFDTGGDDSLIGVINNTKKTIFSISFAPQPNDIFGFDGDGIGSVNYLNLTNALDTSNGAYGGGDAYFTGIAGPFGGGTVNFIGGIAPGSSGYFSLENPVSISAPPILAPEPATWAMMLLGFAGLGFAGYRSARKTALAV